MVERAILTKRIVDEATAPPIGERWISDTKVRGFGLRTWRNRSGQIGKCYCVRVRDLTNRAQRRTFVAWRDLDWYEFRRLFLNQATLGDLSDHARRWAVDQIDILKGRSTLQEEIEENRAALGDQLGRTTLGRAIDSYLRGRRFESLSQGYLDRLDKLLSRFVPDTVRALPIASVTAEAISGILDSRELSPGNLRVLRPALKDIFNRYRSISWGRNAVTDASSSLARTDTSDWPAPSQRLPNWTEEQFRTLFQWLQCCNESLQQGLCLSLFIRIYGVPMTAAMSAKWDQFYLVKVGSSYFGSGEQQECPMWSWDSRPWKRHVFRSEDMDLFDTLQGSRLDGCDYLFPSRLGRSVHHIRSVDHVWRSAIAEFGLPYVSPRAFRAHYQALRMAGHWWHKSLDR